MKQLVVESHGMRDKIMNNSSIFGVRVMISHQYYWPGINKDIQSYVCC